MRACACVCLRQREIVTDFLLNTLICAGMMPHTAVKVPVIGTFVLDVEDNRRSRWMNETVPHFPQLQSMKSKVLRCVLLDDPGCYCDNYNRFINKESLMDQIKTRKAKIKDLKKGTLL